MLIFVDYKGGPRRWGGGRGRAGGLWCRNGTAGVLIVVCFLCVYFSNVLAVVIITVAMHRVRRRASYTVGYAYHCATLCPIEDYSSVQSHMRSCCCADALRSLERAVSIGRMGGFVRFVGKH